MLLYYASNGIRKVFRPAKKTIHDATGIPESRIKDIRRKLKKLNLIDVETERDSFIFVNWTAIKGFALLPEPLEVGGKAYSNFAQEQQQRHQRYPQLRIQESADQIVSHLYGDDCLTWLASLTDHEYKQIRTIYRSLADSWGSSTAAACLHFEGVN